MEVSADRSAATQAAPLGFWMAVALVMGNMVGSGVFLLPASLAPFGAISLAGWLMSTAGAVLLALVFARLAASNPAAGGPYAYTRVAFGELAGFIVAWGYWISVWSSNAALSVAFVGYLDPFFPSIVRNPASSAGLAIIALWTLTAVNLRGVRTAGVVQVATTVLKIVPLVMVGVGGLFIFNHEYFAIADTSPRTIAHGVTATATLTLWAFLGLECATIPAGDIRNPERTIPRATIIGTLLAAAIYIVGTIAVMTFGFCALFLAAAGLYGVMSFAVTQRTREMGVRSALGARGAQLITLVMRKTIVQLGAGLVLGLMLALLASDKLQPVLYHVNPRDAIVFSGVIATLAIAALLASFLPARRVTRIDPVVALAVE